MAATGSSHEYAPLPAADRETVDGYLHPCTKDGKRAYQCLWDGCEKDPFKGRHSARVHVQKHLGHDKLFYCTTCFQEFTSEDIAKRHHEGATIGKVYPCIYCHETFTRKDYRNLHQDKCASK